MACDCECGCECCDEREATAEERAEDIRRADERLAQRYTPARSEREQRDRDSRDNLEALAFRFEVAMLQKWDPWANRIAGLLEATK